MSLPSHLAQEQAIGICEGEPVAQFEIGSHRNFVYLILDWSQKKAALIDPHSGIGPVLTSLDQFGFKLTQILITHSHWDHIAGLPELSPLCPDVPVLVHPRDEYRIREQRKTHLTLEPLHDHQTLMIGALRLQVIHTPGHSAGECCFYLDITPPYLFTGDTVFIRDCGRTDLETGSNSEMFDSIQRIKQLPPETGILPGHHYQRECASTLLTEIQESPPFQCKTVQELSRLP